jgi:hypothetical protein
MRQITSRYVILAAFILPAMVSATIQPGPWKNKKQQIPGRIECEWYDEGGEGIAYHDDDAVNNGSGRLNPVNGTFLNEFRMQEGVDISYTKGRNIDNTIYNKVPCDTGSLYVGWTKPGEWIRYTVQVAKSGIYEVSTQYTANGEGTISLQADREAETPPLLITSTHDDSDTIAWRQWHHWNRSIIGKMYLKKGSHSLKLNILTNGNLNLDYLEFKRVTE